MKSEPMNMGVVYLLRILTLLFTALLTLSSLSSCGAVAPKEPAEPTPPTVSISLPANYDTVSTNFSIYGTAVGSAGITGVYLSINSGSFSAVQGTTDWYTNINSTAGTYTYQFYAIDGAGISSVTNQLILTNDDTYPLLYITNNITNGYEAISNVYIAGKAIASGGSISQVFCSKDGGAYTPVNGTTAWYTNIQPLAKTQTFRFYALDSNAKQTAKTQIKVTSSATPLFINGRLRVINRQLCNESGLPIQLRGMSSHGLQWYGQFMNNESIAYLTTNWKADIIRAAMYVKEGGYIDNPSVKNKVIEIANAAESNGIYCMIDWHILTDNDPNTYKTQALTFFTNMAELFKNKKHILYEICNEPNQSSVTWAGQIKPYAEYIIPAIRAVDPSSVIIVGTGEWSQKVDDAAASPLSYSNVLYSVHFYSGTHTQWLRDRVAAALPTIGIFCTEWGTSQSSGTGGPYLTEASNWMTFLEANKISWCNWSLCDKNEVSAALKPGASTSGGWNNSTMSDSGIFVRDFMSNR